MNKIVLFSAITASVICISACSEAPRHHVEVAETKPTIRMTLVPVDSSIGLKLNNIQTRALVTKNDLTQPLQIFAIDPALSDFHVITPQDSSIPGVYNFQFPIKATDYYRIWADVKPNTSISKTGAEEFPQASLGQHKPININKTESREANVGGKHFTLSFDNPVVEGEESIGTIRVDNGANVFDIIGFYDDFRSILHLTLDKDGKFHLIPKKPGFIKLFARIKTADKEIYVPFGINIGKAN